nr:MAG TPA: hypothetical protein [Caudoviricetes sp.]
MQTAAHWQSIFSGILKQSSRITFKLKTLKNSCPGVTWTKMVSQ